RAGRNPARSVFRRRRVRHGCRCRARSGRRDHLVDALRRARGRAGGRGLGAAAPGGVGPLAPTAGRAAGDRASLRRISHAARALPPGWRWGGGGAARRRAAAPGARRRGRGRPDSRSRRAQRAGAAPARDPLRSGRRRSASRARRADSRVPQERRRRGALAPASLNTLVRAALVAIGATLIAALLVVVGGPGITALDWSVYDRWLRSRAPLADTPRLVVIARDAASEARFGGGAWDRAVLARVVTALGRGGAAVVGLDVALGTPSAPGRGGAASDALL